MSNVHEYFRSNGDARTDNWLLVYEPSYILAFTIGYLLVVLIGPKWMEKREGFDLRKLLIVYNFFLVGLSGWMLHEFIATTVFNPNFSFWCQPTDPTDTSEMQMRQLNVSWWYFFSKIIEYMDTFFFILRKKNRQITFLHVYHHSTVLFVQWLSVKQCPGGSGCFAGMLNCFIHVLMYGYYMLSAFGPHMQKYLWWKRYLTRLQIIQFLMVFIHTSYAIKHGCGYSKTLSWMLWVYMMSLFMLFSHFYNQAYKSKKEAKKIE